MSLKARRDASTARARAGIRLVKTTVRSTGGRVDKFVIFATLFVKPLYFKPTMDDSFAGFLAELETKEQPTCNINSPEDCEACGS